MTELPSHLVAALAALPIGLILGALVQRTNFCVMGAISDAVLFGDLRRLRAWLLAIAIALLGTQALAAADFVDLGQSIYLSPRLGWAGALIGGLLFGIGMVFAGGCGNRNLVRLGTGDLRALFVVLVLAISAVTTLHGLTALLRVNLDQATAVDMTAAGFDGQALSQLFAAAFGAGDGDGWGLGLALVLAAVLAVFCFASRAFRATPRNIASGFGLGLLVVAGWWVTGVLAFDDFDPQPLVSLTFVAPVGNSLLYLMTFTGSHVSFGVAVVAGVVLGAFAMSLLRGEFRVQGFADTADLLRSLFGSGLMGFGGVTALGCTIGQGVTGLSTLSLGSCIAVAAIVCGGVIGVHLLDRMSG